MVADELDRDLAAAFVGHVGELAADAFSRATVMIWSSCLEPVPPILIWDRARP